MFWALLIGFASINAFASNITLDFGVSGNGQKPVLILKTNLPAGTILMATLVSPVDQGGTGYFGQAQATVQPDHIVQFGPFSKEGGRLAPGTYQFTVSTIMAALQPPEVQTFFGAHGEQLAGPRVLILPGTSERMVSQKFQFAIAQDGSVANSLSELKTIGSAGDIWKKFQGAGREIEIKTNGLYYKKPNYPHYGFRTYVAANFPDSTISGRPQSIMSDVEGNCSTRKFHVLGALYFAGKNRSGIVLESVASESAERTLDPNSAFEKAFDLLCQAALEQK